MFDKKRKAQLLVFLMSIAITSAAWSISLYIPSTKAEGEVATYYLDPPTLTDLNISDTFDMIIKFKDFTQLWMWQAGLQWDPAVLECLEVVAFKPFYRESVFAVLAPTRSTAFIDGTIDNPAGKIYPPYAETLKAPGEGVTGTTGVGYNIMKVTFRVKGYAPEGSDIQLLETEWSAFPDVGIFLPHNDINATIFTVTPPEAKSPVANFTWTPAEPIVNETVTFDASSSVSGFNGTHTIPITEYRWDFNGDGTFDKTVATPTTTWNYTIEGNYNVTLEVWAPDNYPPDVPDTSNITKTITIAPIPPPPVARTFVYVDPPRINATTIGENFTVYIKIKDFAQLWAWQVGLQWDPTKLNCTSVLAGPPFTEGVFKVLAPGRYTIIQEGTIDNTAGQIYPPYAESLTIPGEGVNSVPGEVYNLMKITFQVKATGIVDFHLYETTTYYYPDGKEGETIMRDMFTVTLPEGDFPIEIVTNSTGPYQKISNHRFAGPPQNKTSFVITCVSKKPYAATTQGFCNVTIPIALMWDGPALWIILANGEIVSAEIQQNTTHNLIHFTYPHKTDGKGYEPQNNLIEIMSPYAIPEFSPPWLLIALLIATLALASLSKLNGHGENKNTLSKRSHLPFLFLKQT